MLTKMLCLCQGAVVFLVTVNVYAYEKSEIAETSMVALSGCIWIQAFLVALETKYEGSVEFSSVAMSN